LAAPPHFEIEFRKLIMTDANNVMNEIQLVVFDLASEHYGVDISAVREIIRMQTVTKVPGAMACVEGVINLRSTVLPVLDLRKRLELKVTEHTEDSRIVIIDISTGQVGVIVDAVTEVLRVDNSNIDPPSTMVAHGDADYVKGIAKLSDRLIILLDLQKLLSLKAISESLRQVEDKSGELAEQDSTAKAGNGNKKKSAELTHTSNTKEYAVV
jgi:purine-binding chemotaxis protein CheW